MNTLKWSFDRNMIRNVNKDKLLQSGFEQWENVFSMAYYYGSSNLNQTVLFTNINVQSDIKYQC